MTLKTLSLSQELDFAHFKNQILTRFSSGVTAAREGYSAEEGVKISQEKPVRSINPKIAAALRPGGR